MEFDEQMLRYFGTTDLGAVSPAVLATGHERLAVDFGLESNRGRRFAMWALMHLLGNAPDPDAAFADPLDQDAARNFRDLLAAGNS